MMKNRISGVEGYLTRLHRKRIEKGIVRVLSLVVVCCIMYSLMLPGITLETKAYCGHQEHVHEEGCDTEMLICQLPESVEDGHIHSETCYERVNLCGMEEHTHSLSCYSDPEADVETADQWERTIPDLSGHWAKDLIAVAKSQIGYRESEENYAVDEDDATRGYTRYGAWSGDPYGDWNAAFAAFCLHYAQIPESAMPAGVDCAQWVSTLQERALYRNAQEYVPAAGDLVFLDSNWDGDADSVGVVAEATAGEDGTAIQITTVEGDLDGRVDYAVYPISDGCIMGYGQLPENPNAPVAETAPTTEATEETVPETTVPEETVPETTASEETVPETTAAEETVPETTVSEETAPETTAPAETAIETAVPVKTMPQKAFFSGLSVNKSALMSVNSVALSDIYVGDTVTVNIPTGGDVAYFRFVPEVTHEYVFQSSNANTETYCALYDENMDEITYDYGSCNFMLTHTLMAGKTYYWGTRYWSSSRTGSFTVTLSYGVHSFDPEGKCICGKEAQEIQLGDTVTVNIPTGGDIAYFRFVPEVTHEYVFQSSDADSYIYGYLYDEDLNQIMFSYYYYNFKLTHRLEAGKVYYWGAKYDSSDSTGSFSATLSYGQGVHSFDAEGHCACGAVVQEIPLGDAVTVNIPTEGDIAYFQFVPEVTHTYVFEAKNTGMSACCYLYDGDMKLITSAYSDYYNNYLSLMSRLEAGKTYYWGATYNYGNTGSFKATLSYGQVEHSFDAEGYCACGAEVTEIQLGDTTTVNIQVGGTTEYFRFVPEVTHEYVFQSSNASAYTYGYLYDENMDQITSASGYYNFELTYRLEAGKVYYWGAKYDSSGTTGSFTATLTYGVHGFGTEGQCPCGAVAQEIQLGDAVSVNIPTGGDIAYFRFVPGLTHEYVFRSSNASVDTYGYLYDENMNQLWFAYGYNDFELTCRLEAGKTYYWGARYYSSGTTGSFTATLSYGQGVHSFDAEGHCACGAVVQEIQLGDAVTVNIPTGGDGVYFRFVPELTHEYVFRPSSADTYIYGVLYDENSVCCYYDFELMYRLEAGKTYYWSVAVARSDYDSGSTGSFSVTLSYGTHDFDTDGQCICGAEAQEIQLGDTAAVNIQTGGTTEYFRFVPEATHEYVFQSSNADTYTSVFLYDENMAWLMFACGYEDNNNFRLAYSLEAGKTYYLGVKYSSSSTTGSFSVTPSYGTHGFGTDGQCTCGVNTIQLGDTVSVNIQTGGTGAYIRFVPEVTHSYVFQSTNAGENTCGCLYDENMDLIMSASGSNNFKLTRRLEAGKTYYWGAKYDSSGSTGSFTVTLSYGRHIYSPEGVCACGAEIPEIRVGDTVSANISTGGDIAYFRFVPEVTHEYGFKASDYGVNVYSYLYDENMNQLACNRNYYSDFDVTHTLEAGKTYYWGAKYGSPSETGSFTATLSYGFHRFDREGKCTCGEESQIIQLGDTVTVNIPTGGDVAYFQFVPEVTHFYVFQSHDASENTYSWLYDENLDRLTSAYSYEDNNFRLAYLLEAGKTYYLGVRYSSSGSTGSFSATLSYGSHSYTPEGICGCGAEAQTIQLGDTVDVNIQTGGTTEYFRFVPEVTHSYVFRSSNASAYTDGYLYDENMNQLARNRNYYGDFDVTHTLEAGKTYYWGAKYYRSNSTGSFTATLSYGAHSFDPEMMCACGVVAQAIQLGDTVTINIPTGGDVAYFRFVPEATHYYVFQASNASTNTYGYLYDENMSQLTSASGSNNFNLTYMLEAGKTYYWGAKYNSSGSTGSFSATLSYGDHRYTPEGICACGAEAPEIQVGDTVAVNIQIGGTMEYFRFVPEATHEYVFRSSDASTYTYGYLYDENMNWLTSTSGSYNFKLTYTLEAGKTYYWGAKYNSASDTGSFNVTLSYGMHSFDPERMCACGIEAQAIQVGDTATVNIQTAGTTEYICFVPEATHEYVFQSVNAGANTYCVLYDENMNQLSSASGYYNFKQTYTLEAGKTYYWGAKYNSSSYTGSFTATLSYGSHQSGMCTCAKPEPIQLGDTVSVNILTGGDIAYFQFVPEVTHEYVFQSVNASTNTCGVLYDENKNELKCDYGYLNCKLIYELEAGKVYYWGAKYDSSSKTGSFTAVLSYGSHSYTPEGICGCGAEAPEIQVGDIVTINSLIAGTVAYFRFVPEVTHEYVFQFSGSDMSIYGYLYDENMTQLAYNYNYGVMYTLEAGKTYYWGVGYDCYSDSTGSFTATLSYGSHSYTPEGTCACGAEAREIQVGDTATVNIQTGGTMEYFRFVPEVTHSYVFRSSGSSASARGYLYDENMNELTSAYGYNDFGLTYRLEAGKVYYWGAKYDNSSQIGSFTATLSYGIHSFDQEGKCICGTEAQTIRSGDSVTVNISTGGDVAYFRFVPEVTHKYVFQASNAGANTYGCLYDENMNWLTSAYGYNNFMIMHTLEAGKTYYWGAKYNSFGSTGSFSATLSYGSHSYTPEGICACGAEAPGIQVGDTVTVNISTGGTMEYFRFVPEVTHSYVFWASNANTETYCALYDENMNWLTSASGSDSNNFKLTYRLEAGKVYYWGAGNYYSDSTGSFTATLSYGSHSYAPDGRCACGAEAPGIQVGDTAAVNIQIGGTTEYFRFVPETTHEYVFRSSNASAYTYGYLYDENMNQITSASGYNNFELTYTLEEGKTYFWGAQYSSSGTTGSFTATLSYGSHSYTPEGVCACGAEIPEIRVGDTAAVNIPTGGDIIYFRFVPEVTHEYVFQSSNASANTYGYLYDENMNQLTSASGSNNFKLTYTLEEGKTYFWGAQYSSSGTTGSFTATLSYGSHSYTPEGVCACGAEIPEIRVGDTAAVNIPTGGDIIYFRFVPEVTHSYVFQATNASANTYGYLYDENMNQLTSASGYYNFKLTRTLEAGKVYFWGAKYSGSSSTGNFTATLSYGSHSYAPDGRCACGAEAPEIQVGDTATVNIQIGGTIEYFRFVPEVTHSYVFQATNASAKTYGYLYDENMNQLTSASGSYNFKLTYTLEAGKVYFWGAKYYNSSSTGNFTATLSYGRHIYSPEGVCACGASDAIHVGETATVNITTGGAIEYFRFIPEVTHSYVFQSSGSTDTKGYLYDENLKQLAYDDDGGSGYNFKVTYTLEAGKTYFWGARYYSPSATGSFPATLSYGSHQSGMCTCAKPEPIQLGDTVSVNIPTGGDVAYFRFVPELTHEYVFQASNAGANTYGYLYDENRSQLTSASGSNNFIITYKLEAGKTYYWGAKYSSSGTTGSFSATLSYGSHSYTPDGVCVCGAEAQTIQVGDTVTVSIPTGGTTEYFRFVPEVTHEYEFRSSNAGANTYGYLYDGNLNQLKSASGSYNFNVTYTLEAGKTYYWGAKYSSSGSTGSFPATLSYGVHSFDPDGVCDCGETISVIRVGDTVGVTVPTSGEKEYFLFIPPVTHTYVFESDAGGDPYGYLYDEKMNQITSNDDGGDGYNFRISYRLEAGKTYLWGAGYNGSGTGSYQAALSMGEHAYNSAGVCTDCGRRQNALGDNVTYTLENGVLTVRGTGATYDFGSMNDLPPFSDVKAQITSVVVEDGVTGLGKNLFNGCTNLGSVMIADSVTGIGSAAFYNCNRLTSVTIPEGVRAVERGTFYGCSRLSAVSLPGTLESIGDAAFSNCYLLCSVDIPEGVTYIGEKAFINCHRLGTASIPDSVTRIGDSAFESCDNLGQIELPRDLTVLGNNAFSGCSKATSVYLNSRNLDTNSTQWANDLACVSSLTVGQGVDLISTSFLSQMGGASENVTQIRFEGENYFTLGDNLPGNWSLSQPIAGMTAGEYYTDGFGVTYQLFEDNTAKLFYVPAGPETYTVLSEVPANNGAGPWVVTAVEPGALRQSSLTEITFEAPGNIIQIPAEGLGVCPTLIMVNGCGTVESATASFTNPDVQIDAFAFYGSGLRGYGNPDVVNEDFVIEVTGAGDEKAVLARINISPKEGDKYSYLTGEKATANLFVDQLHLSEPDYRYVRFYFAFDADHHNMSMEPGEYTNDGYEYSIFETSVSGIYCVRVPIEEEATFRLAIDALYFNILSGKGNLRLWAVALTEQEDADLGSGIRLAETCQQLTWNIQPKASQITKVLNNTTPDLKGDGTVNGKVYLAGLRYKIAVNPITDDDSGMGKDLVQRIHFTDTVEIPEGVHLLDEVAYAVRAGQYQVEYNGRYNISVVVDGAKRTLASIGWLSGSTGNLQLTDFEVDVDHEGRLVFSWTEINTVAHLGAKSLNVPQHAVEVTYGNQVFAANRSEITRDMTISVIGSVSAEEIFLHSEPVTETALCTYDVEIIAPTVTVENSYVNSGRWGYGAASGQNQYIDITLRNPSLFSFAGIQKIRNPLNSNCYIPGIKMEQMISEVRNGTVKGVESLEFTITYAQFGRDGDGDYVPGSQVIGTDGETYTLTHGNSGVGTSYDGMESVDDGVLNKSPSENDRITVTYDARSDTVTLSYQYTGDNGFVSDERENVTDIGAVLEEIGYFVTPYSRYCVVWNMAADYSLSGESADRVKLYYANKDSFMYIGQDTRKVASVQYYISNAACVYYLPEGSEDVANESASYIYRYPSRDWELYCYNAVGGKTLFNDDIVMVGDVITYTIGAYLSGGSSYEIVPLTAHLEEGSQILLAPVSGNETVLGNQGLETYTTDDGTAYYLLKVPAGETAHTYRGVVLDGKTTDSITVTGQSDELDYLIHWYLTDFGTSAAVSYRTLAEHEKPEQAGIDAISFPLSSEFWLNDHETHRLYDRTDLKATMIRSSYDIVTEQGATPDADKLTDRSTICEGQSVTYRATLEYAKKDEAYTITGEEIRDILPSTGSAFTWDSDNIDVSYSGVTFGNSKGGEVTSIQNENGTWSVVWDSDLTMTFTDKMYIYVTVTFPDGEQWDDFAKQFHNTQLKSDFELGEMKDTVSHELAVAAEAYLQQGVLSTSANYSTYYSNAVDSRLLYNNRDNGRRYVQYYVVLYNNGGSKLYLNPIQDVLPAGFTYYGNIYTNSYRPTVFGADGSVLSPTWVSGGCSASTTMLSSGQRVTFQLTPYDRFDSTVGKYYLAPGEAFCFSYTCEIGYYSQTEDRAVNTVAMPFYDPNGLGVRIAGVSAVGAARGSGDESTKNDGRCALNATLWANSVGFEGGDAGTYWLASDVTMTRGMIQPGVSAAVESITHKLDGVEEKNPEYSGLQDTINWAVTAYSGSNAAIRDYTLTDVMQAPYSFTGEVKLSTSYAGFYSSGVTGISGATLFTIGERLKTDLDSITLTYQDNGTTRTDTIRRGEELTFTHSSYGRITVSVYVNGDGNEAISVQLHGDMAAIPEGGSAKLIFSAVNVTGVYSHKDFYNSAYLTPSQTFDPNTVTKGHFTLLDGKDSVRSGAQIFVAYGHVVTYSQSVEALADSTNRAVSSDLDNNTILLPDKQNVFRYSLKMKNLTVNNVDRLVLINSLAQVGDHSVFTPEELRYSDFWVRLADDPNFVVMLDDQVLDSTAYSLEFSDRTEFTREDWEGTSVWSAAPDANTRSFRIVMGDEISAVVGPGKELTVSFNGQILLEGGNAAELRPGQTGWNGFGIHFHVVGDDTYMDASPLSVGVRIPGIPVLQSKLIRQTGEQSTADRDIITRFLVYSGSEISGLTNARSEADIQALLTENGRECIYAERTVAAGSGQSEELYLVDQFSCEYNDNSGEWEQTQTPWSWIETRKYTVIELPSRQTELPENDQYFFWTLGGIPGKSYTFAYTRSLSQRIAVVDMLKEWNLQVNVTEVEMGLPLADAWFGIYSLAASDSLTGEIPYAPTDEQKTLTYEGRTYYLMGVECSDEVGVIVWNGLTKGEYLVTELQVPDGYCLDGTVIPVSGEDVNLNETVCVDVVIVTGYMLPKSGGFGTEAFRMLGVALCIGTAAVYVFRKRYAKKRQ